VPKQSPALRGKPPAANGSADGNAIHRLAKVFKALADEHRLHILSLLSARGEMSVSAIGAEVGQSQPAVSHHLTQLRSAGLIDFRRAGKFNFYHLDEAGLVVLFDDVFPAGGTGRVAVGVLEIGVKKK
jgi:ArsR family transcriptional regulator, arsenate/arsenite/antimonite-responsive transcriptional repressor